jgi:soluble lytic murein transglycosylase-like protein
MSKIAAMRVRFTVLLPLALTGLIAPSAASADCVHVVVPGDSLTSVAAADGLTIDALAAANGLSPAAQLIAGTCLTIPPQGSPSGAPSAAAESAASTTPGGDGDGDGDDQAAAAAPVSTPAPAPVTSGDGDADSDDAIAASTSAAPSSQMGSYVVQPGDTLTAIAARAGTTVEQLAAANGLNPLAPLLSGTVLQLSASGLPQSSSGSASAAMSQPVGAAAEGSPVNPPYPTPQLVSPSEVSAIAAANGVPPSLADAIAYQESGFNNGLVSSADARGVMQILPGTWNWIQHTLVPGASPLASASATDNIRGGVLLLRSLLNATGGNAAMAAAGYYQGLPSVERNGMFPSTQQYVGNILALQQRFSGGG